MDVPESSAKEIALIDKERKGLGFS